MGETCFVFIVLEQSNWMRFVRAAESLSEQNLLLSQEGNQLFYTTTRSIEPKEELKVWYSAPYAKQRGLHLLDMSRKNGKGSAFKISKFE